MFQPMLVNRWYRGMLEVLSIRCEGGSVVQQPALELAHALSG